MFMLLLTFDFIKGQSSFVSNIGKEIAFNIRVYQRDIFCSLIMTLPTFLTLSPPRLFNSDRAYSPSHILVQPNFRRYYFYFLSDQAQILLDHFNVLDEL